MKKNITKIFYPVVMLTALACSDSFLNVPAKGVLSPTQLQSQAGVEQILIAYSDLKGSQTSNGNIGTWATSPTGWVYGGVVGEEAFKGSNSGNQATINPLSQFSATSTNPYIGDMWISLYDGVTGLIRRSKFWQRCQLRRSLPQTVPVSKHEAPVFTRVVSPVCQGNVEQHSLHR